MCIYMYRTPGANSKTRPFFIIKIFKHLYYIYMDTYVCIYTYTSLIPGANSNIM